MRGLSKARFVAGTQCVKRLHLECHAPELREPDASGRDALAAAGVEIGTLARGRYPGGVLVEGYLERRLIVRFDERGVVEAVEFEEKTCPRVGVNEHGRTACLDLVALDLSDKEVASAEPAVVASFEHVLWLRSRRCPDPATVGSSAASASTAFRGTLLDPFSFLVDIEDWGYEDRRNLEPVVDDEGELV